jgi:hypothetical protein
VRVADDGAAARARRSPRITAEIAKNAKQIFLCIAAALSLVACASLMMARPPARAPANV